MKVYVAVIENYLENMIDSKMVRVFDTQEKATDFLEKNFKTISEDFESVNGNELIKDLDQNKMSFEIYEEGRYETNHAWGIVEEREVE